MAKATYEEIGVEKVVVVTQKVVQLNLSEDEAQTLADILAKVGGSFRGRRKHSAAILEALKTVDLNFQSNTDLWGEQMMFKDE